jgi:hypothetical protein
MKGRGPAVTHLLQVALCNDERGYARMLGHGVAVSTTFRCRAPMVWLDLPPQQVGGLSLDRQLEELVGAA